MKKIDQKAAYIVFVFMNKALDVFDGNGARLCCLGQTEIHKFLTFKKETSFDCLCELRRGEWE